MSIGHDAMHPAEETGPKSYRFSIEGRPKPDSYLALDADEDVRITWDDGVLSGDIQAIEGMRMLATMRDGYPVGPIPMAFTYYDHLKNPLSFQMLAGEWFAAGYRVTGNPPKFPEFVPGRIY